MAKYFYNFKKPYLSPILDNFRYIVFFSRINSKKVRKVSQANVQTLIFLQNWDSSYYQKIYTGMNILRAKKIIVKQTKLFRYIAPEILLTYIWFE